MVGAGEFVAAWLHLLRNKVIKQMGLINKMIIVGMVWGWSRKDSGKRKMGSKESSGRAQASTQSNTVGRNGA